jgi:hypothetical protein
MRDSFNELRVRGSYEISFCLSLNSFEITDQDGQSILTSCAKVNDYFPVCALAQNRNE